VGLIRAQREGNKGLLQTVPCFAITLLFCDVSERNNVAMMRLPTLLGLIPLLLSCSLSSAEPCRVIHGRAILYSGDGLLEIWRIGTHHTFFVVDEKSTDLILKYIPYEGGDRQKALFADFTICPTARFKQGASQATIVTRIRHAHIVTR
jgi:hypothetical protein